MPTIPRNKWTIAAFCWLLAGIYGLVFHESGNQTPPPIRHFDKLVHFFLFFTQFRLAAQAYIVARIRPPYFALLVAALIYAIASEAAQHFFTTTRQADIFDFAADMCGAAAALQLAKLRFRLPEK